MTTTSEATVEKYRQNINAIDLEPIKFKLVKEEGWSLKEADETEKYYKGYLLLSALHPEQANVPTKSIDKMWHAHILDTKKYTEDCQRVFGRYIHHFPYFGMRGEEDERTATEAFKDTQARFKEIVGFDMTRAPGAEKFDTAMEAWSRCQSQPGCVSQCSDGGACVVGSISDLEKRPTRANFAYNPQ